MNLRDAFLTRGWAHFPFEQRLSNWIDAVRDRALATAEDPAFAEWHRLNGTWFVGVNALDNDRVGAVEGAAPLACGALDLTRDLYGSLDLDAAQVSIISNGYPSMAVGDSESAHRFRLHRDAAHVDGFKPHGPNRRRHLDECHAFILGLPLTGSRNSPLVVWEGSHEVIRNAMHSAFAGALPDEIAKVDITDLYQQTRRRIFETCKRVELPAAPGEATLVHRLALHGIAPWGQDLEDETHRAILYFRPALPGGPKEWLTLP